MRATTRLRRALTLLVATALVTAQLSGLVHRVEHPAGTGSGAPAAPAALHAMPLGPTAAAAYEQARHDRGHDDVEHDGGHAHDHAHHHADNAGSEGGAAHHCAAFDAATLGDGPPLASAVSVRTRQIHSTPCARLAYLTTGVAALGYFSRAPPLS
ncbi:MAG TPA: hypothetical protein VFR86_25560 [Burkholderiaceae bacterium]|nr:hypothetical protein [Burkholderiaceae bacterium]